MKHPVFHLDHLASQAGGTAAVEIHFLANQSRKKFLHCFLPRSAAGQDRRSYLSILEGNPNQRQNIGIALLLTLELQQVVIGAILRFRVFAANEWTRVVDLALARHWIQERASLPEYRIRLAA